MTSAQILYKLLGDQLTGPRAGPKKGADAKMLIATPLSRAWNISAITPPAFVKGEDPKEPAKKRRMMTVHIF